MLNKMNGCSEEINGNKYLTVISANERKEKIKKCEEMLIKIRDVIKSVTKTSDDYDEKCIKIKLDSDDKLPLYKTIEIPITVIVVTAISYENNKYYPQVCIKYKMLNYDDIDVSEEIDVNKTSTPKKCDVCSYWYFLNYSFRFQPNVCNRCHGLLMMSINLSDVAILNIKGSDYCCIISLISKNEAIILFKNADLTKKSEKL